MNHRGRTRLSAAVFGAFMLLAVAPPAHSQQKELPEVSMLTAVPNFASRGVEARITGRFGTRSEKNHVLTSGIVELVKLPRRNDYQHAGVKRPRRSVRKMKRALTLHAIKLLIRRMLVHRSFGTRIIAV